MIGLEDVTVSFRGRSVLAGLSFAVERGRILAILGPNGRGKTTALKVLLGEQKPDRGRRTAPDCVGYVPQSVSSPLAYSALDMVEMGAARGLGLFARPGPAERTGAREALLRVGIGRLAGSRFDRLSGGERQLVLLARALATGSPALLLDEPTAALDLGNTRLVLGLVADLGAAGDHAVVFSTHDPNQALAVADEALLMLPDGETLQGPVGTVVTEANLRRLYDTPLRLVSFADQPGGAIRRHLVPDPIPTAREARPAGAMAS